MATRSFTYGSHNPREADWPGMHLFRASVIGALKETMQKDIGNKVLRSEGTLQYRLRGSDTLTLGNQENWLEIRKLVHQFVSSVSFLSEQNKSIAIREQYPLLSFRISEFENIIKEAIIEMFPKIPEVSLIYSEYLGTEWQFKIFIDTKKHDRVLMEKLLDLEIEILDMFPSENISFQYPPLVLVSNIEDVISSEAQLIYKKG